MNPVSAREWIEDHGYEDVMIFDNPSYDDAFIGVTTDNRAAYDYDMIVAHLVESEGMDPDEAAEYVDYNVVGSTGGDGTPVVIRTVFND